MDKLANLANIEWMSVSSDPGRPFVLLAGTDRSKQQRYESILSGAAIEIAIRSSAGAALTLLRSRNVDVIITDVMLPSLDGFALARAIRALHASVPIIVVSHEPLANDGLVRAFEAGALVLTESVDDETFLAAVRDQIASHRNRRPPRPYRVRRAAPREVPATTAKNEFGRVVDAAIKEGRVIITKHQRPHAVVLAFEEYEQLLSRSEPNLDDLTREFDHMLARMQTPKARAAADALFTTSSAELGRAAVAAATKK